MDWTYNILGPDPAAGLMVVLILVIIEGVLSVDNAAVLATMVMRLPEHQRGKALKYGIIGAYAFRGLCLALAAWLITIWWLEPLGGLYLLWLAWSHFSRHESVIEEGVEAVETEGNFLYRCTIGLLGPFWATVAAVVARARLRLAVSASWAPVGDPTVSGQGGVGVRPEVGQMLRRKLLEA